MTRGVVAIAVFSLLLASTGCESDVLLTPSARPERLYAVSNAHGALLYWDAVPGATGYRVYSRHVEDDDFDLAVERPTNFAFVDFNDDAAYLAVAARRGNDESAKSPEILGVKQPEYVSPNYVLAVTSTAGGFASAIQSVGDIDGDGFEDVLVGAPLASGGAGAVYLFRGAAGGLDEAPRVVATGTSGSQFGASIAYSETFLQTSPVAIVGAPGGAGAAYLYQQLGSAHPFETVVPLPLQGAPGSGFGSVVVSAGNLDGLVPVHEEIAVSAPDAFGGEGRVYVFQGGSGDTDSSDPLVGSIEVRPELVTASSRFGFSMAAAGNLETDPEDDLIIGAPGHANIGAVAVLPGDLAMFASTAATAAFTAYGSGPGSQFGWSVTSLGDPDSDDRDEYAVGSPQDDCDQGGEGKGSVMVLNPGAGEGYAVECGRQGEHFGYSLGFAGTVFNDEEQFLVGSYSTSGDGSFALARWRLEPETTPVEGGLSRFEPAGFSGGGYGRVLASADVNGDGRPDVLVGIPEASTMHVFVTIPENGPELLLGGPIDATEGSPVSFSSAFINDTASTSYSCSVLWGDEPDVSAATIVEACTSDALRELPHAYAITDPENDGRQDYFATVNVFSLDGRSGTAVTRVRVRP